MISWMEPPIPKLPYTTGISFEEMELFLRRCSVHGVRRIIESGRGKHAYSTQILGEYQKRRAGVEIISIDWEQRLWNRWVSRWRVRRYPGVELIRGEGCWWIGHILHRRWAQTEACIATPPVTAILLDGPKGHLAMNHLDVWRKRREVVVMAIHNGPDHGEFAERWRRDYPHPEFIGNLHLASKG